ncbi:MAG TPA: hypothetical protein ENG33_10725 [Chloroflexi bacterium]|nr:hypothetical protein [Chloroflexota bacterium]
MLGCIRRRSDLISLVILFVSFRFFALMLLRPGGFIADYSDFNTSFLPFARWSRYALYPYVHFWMEYPPLFPWLVVVLYRLSLLLPPWNDPRLWFNTLMGLTVLAFEVGNLMLIYLIGCRIWGRDKGRLAGWFYLGLFAPFYTALGWFDNPPLFFILLALYLWLLKGNLGPRFRWASGIALGIGFMLKIVPGLALPLGFRLFPKKKSLLLYASAFTITVALISAPFFLQNPRLFITSFRAMAGRSSWETVWALVDNYYSYGVIAGDRFSTPESFAVHPSRIPGIVPFLLWSVVYLGILSYRGGWGESRRLVAAVALVFTSYFLFAKGYSPQHIVYLLPFIILLMPNLKGIVYAIILTWFNLMEATGYFIMFPDQQWLLMLTVAMRTLTLLALCIEYATSLWGGRLSHLARWAFTGWLLIALGAAVLSIPRLGGAYFHTRIAQEPCHELISRVALHKPEGDVALLFLGGELHDRLYPYLPRSIPVYLLPEEPLSTGALGEERAKFITRVRGQLNGFWVVVDKGNPSDQEALAWLEGFLGQGETVIEAGQCAVISYPLK